MSNLLGPVEPVISLSRLSGGMYVALLTVCLPLSLSRLSGGMLADYESHVAINSLSRLSGGMYRG